MTRIGYIGLGAMGGALARRLAPHHPLMVWDLDPAASAAFEPLGATVAPSAAALARQCDIVLLCLPRSSDVEQLLFGPSGLAEGMAAGTLVIDQTSGMPDETRAMAGRLAAQGVELVDAPVSGGVAGAAAGTIAIMLSGRPAACKRAAPVLLQIGPNLFRCGDRVGDGQAMKLVNNLLSAGCRLATLEVVALGRKIGLPLWVIADAINKGSGRNRTSQVTLQDLSEGKGAASDFALALMLKDLNQAVRMGMENGAPTTLTNTVRGLLQAGVNTLGAKARLEDMIGLLESMAGSRIDDAARRPPAPPVSSPKTLRVGYVGLGAMGGALTRRLMLSREMRVFDRQPDTVRAFVAEGALPAADLPSLARDSDVIFVCVPTSALVREVIFGPDGLAGGLAPGKIVVDQTTGDPALTRAIAAELVPLGVALVDAPVSGGPRGAVAGTIAIMCGGPEAALAQVLPLLAQVSPNIVCCGATGTGHEAKLVQNAVAACNHLLVYEAAVLAARCGLKLADMAAVINRSTGWSGASERILPTLSLGKASVDFQMQLMVKDLKLARRMALDHGAPMLIASTVCSMFEMGVQTLGATTNVDAMARWFESMSGTRFEGA